MTEMNSLDWVIPYLFVGGVFGIAVVRYAQRHGFIRDREHDMYAAGVLVFACLVLWPALVMLLAVVTICGLLVRLALRSKSRGES